MKPQKPRCNSLGCAVGCYAQTAAGFALLVVGVALVFTLWLMPIGLGLALVGVAMIDPGQACI